MNISWLLGLNLFINCVILLFSNVFVESLALKVNIDPQDIFSIPWESALTYMLILGLVFLSMMIYFTGGGINSPYITFFGLFPVLGILFNKEVSWMLWYLSLMFVLGVFLFLINAPFEELNVKRKSYRAAFLIGEISSILIATFIGFIPSL